MKDLLFNFSMMFAVLTFFTAFIGLAVQKDGSTKLENTLKVLFIIFICGWVGSFVSLLLISTTE